MPQEIDYLIQGYKRFHQEYFGKNQSLYANLAKNGQKPRYLVIACSDSRVDPAILTDCQPGDLFVIRNVANLVPPCEFDTHYRGTSAALEFGICDLGIRHVIVLGHSQCGGITALLEHYGGSETGHLSNDSFVEKWMGLADATCTATLRAHAQTANLPLSEKANLCAQQCILASLNNLQTYPWVASRIEKKALFLHGWYFDLLSGKIHFYSPQYQKFEVF